MEQLQNISPHFSLCEELYYAKKYIDWNHIENKFSHNQNEEDLLFLKIFFLQCRYQLDDELVIYKANTNIYFQDFLNINNSEETTFSNIETEDFAHFKLKLYSSEKFNDVIKLIKDKSSVSNNKLDLKNNFWFSKLVLPIILIIVGSLSGFFVGRGLQAETFKKQHFFEWKLESFKDSRRRALQVEFELLDIYLNIIALEDDLDRNGGSYDFDNEIVRLQKQFTEVEYIGKTSKLIDKNNIMDKELTATQEDIEEMLICLKQATSKCGTKYKKHMPTYQQFSHVFNDVIEVLIRNEDVK